MRSIERRFENFARAFWFWFLTKYTVRLAMLRAYVWELIKIAFFWALIGLTIGGVYSSFAP